MDSKSPNRKPYLTLYSNEKSESSLEPPSKKLCTVSKKYSIAKDFIYLCGDLQFETCPLCLKFSPSNLAFSCKKCPVYVCKTCSKARGLNNLRCPKCLTNSLCKLTFKDKKLLGAVEFLCPKCLQCAKFENDLSAIRHKLDCLLEGWTVLKLVGDYSDFEGLGEYLLSHQNPLNHLPENFAAFTSLVLKDTERDWNIVYGDCVRFGSEQALVLQSKSNGKKLGFTCLKSKVEVEVEENKRENEELERIMTTPMLNALSPQIDLAMLFDFEESRNLRSPQSDRRYRMQRILSGEDDRNSEYSVENYPQMLGGWNVEWD